MQSCNYEIVQFRSYDEFKTNLHLYKKNLVIFDELVLKGNRKSLFNDINNSGPSIYYLFLMNDENDFKENFIQGIEKIFFLKKPFDLEELKIKVDNILQSNISDITKFNLNLNIPLLEKTEKTKNIFNGIKKVVNNNFNVLISGESGTGKRQIVNTINSLMPKPNYMLELDFLDYRSTNFRNLLEDNIDFSEFLQKKEINANTDPKIIYFKDIDLLDAELQIILTSFLKSKKGRKYFFKNRKIIATTTKNMKQSLRNNNFSNELFYLLEMYNIFSIPLRHRSEDIKILVEEIIVEYNSKYETNKTIDVNAYSDLSNYIWPGNITQLKNFIHRCLRLEGVNLLSKKNIIEELKNEFQYAEKGFIEDWKINFSEVVAKNIRGYLAYNKKINSGIYYKLLKEFERPLIIEILNHTNNNQLLSSEILGINRNTLRKKMADYEIEIIKKASRD